MQELKMKKQIIRNGMILLTPENRGDNYLMQLNDYLSEHKERVARVLQILKDPAETSYGGNLMYMYMQGSTVFIYDITDEPDEREQRGIGINRIDLIEIMKAWFELNTLIEARGGIEELILQRDDEHINMIAHYGDRSEFKRTFNYQCNPDELKALKDYYFED